MIRVHRFLEHWGLINFNVDPLSVPGMPGPPSTIGNRVSHGAAGADQSAPSHPAPPPSAPWSALESATLLKEVRRQLVAHQAALTKSMSAATSTAASAAPPPPRIDWPQVARVVGGGRSPLACHSHFVASRDGSADPIPAPPAGAGAASPPPRDANTPRHPLLAAAGVHNPLRDTNNGGLKQLVTALRSTNPAVLQAAVQAARVEVHRQRQLARPDAAAAADGTGDTPMDDTNVDACDAAAALAATSTRAAELRDAMDSRIAEETLTMVQLHLEKVCL